MASEAHLVCGNICYKKRGVTLARGMYKKLTSNIHTLLTVFASFWCDQVGVLMNSNFVFVPNV